MKSDQQATVSGIDHIGINVPDIDAATTFLQQAFGTKVIYESYSKQQPPLELAGIESTLNVAPGTKIYACRMIKIGEGPTIELFEVHVGGQRDAIKSSDLGLQHFSVYTDNISASIERFESAGGKILSRPNPILFLQEKGDNNFFCYGVTPWVLQLNLSPILIRCPMKIIRRFAAGKVANQLLQMPVKKNHTCNEFCKRSAYQLPGKY